MMSVINIASEFSKTPSGRYLEDGPSNGTLFREQFLLPVLNSDGKACIELEGAAGYPSSFLEEAFGGLVEKCGFSVDKIKATFVIVPGAPRYERYLEMIDTFLNRAALRAAH